MPHLFPRTRSRKSQIWGDIWKTCSQNVGSFYQKLLPFLSKHTIQWLFPLVPKMHLDFVLHSSDVNFCDEATGKVSFWWIFHADHMWASTVYPKHDKLQLLRLSPLAMWTSLYSRPIVSCAVHDKTTVL